MAITIDTLTITNASRPNRNLDESVPIHEIAGSNDSFIQTTGKLTQLFDYEVLLETTDRDSLWTMYNENGVTRTFVDSVNGISCNVKIKSLKENEEVPGLWRIRISLVKKSI